MRDWRLGSFAAVLAAVSTTAMVMEPAVASAQEGPAGYDQGPPPQGQYDQGPPQEQGPPGASYAGEAPGQYGPPQGPAGSYAPQGQYDHGPPQEQGPPQGLAGHYAGGPPAGPYAGPPPAGPYTAAPGAPYEAPMTADAQRENAWRYQQYLADYRAQYAQWAMHNCIEAHNNNAAVGAIIGGVAGAALGAGLAGWATRGAWAFFGGTVGATAGAAIGGSAAVANCPNGYVVRTGAPAFAYAGPVYAPAPYAPGPYYAPYRRWVWVGGRWVWRGYPYRRPYGGGYGPGPYPYYR